MLSIDGSRGEGGGQILRSSLTLSCVTNTPFRIRNIRAGRGKPGLLRQHLTAVKAAAEICDARIEGAELRSQELVFHPGTIRGGNYTFSIGSAGSSNLVLQTILPVLALAKEKSLVTVRGGTHNPSAPSFDYLDRVVFPLIRRMGVIVDATLKRPGFYPAGGGCSIFAISPTSDLKPLFLNKRGALQSKSIELMLAGFPSSIGERELHACQKALAWSQDSGRLIRVNSRGPGRVVSVVLEMSNVTEMFIAFGKKKESVDLLCQNLAAEVSDYLLSDVPVGVHLADQLLMWIALAGKGSFRTLEPTQHTWSQIEIIELFLGKKARCKEQNQAWEISFD